MRALAALYREMAEVLQDSGLFERRLFRLDFADLDGDAGEITAWVTVFARAGGAVKGRAARDIARRC